VAFGERKVVMEEMPFSNEAYSSGVSWAAIIAGAFAAAALSLALLALGTGIGLSETSPWMSGSASATRVGWTAIIWLVATQLIASSVGGYLAGRLRTRWVHVHTHEVYFRDTAHGFLVWAVSLVITAGLLTSVSSVLSGGAVRTTFPTADATYQERSSSVLPTGRIDTPAHAESDNNGDAHALQAADDVRKAFAHSMYWTFVALLIGAFCASLAATIGGRERDRVVVV
jgi:hypothetical protein